MRNHSIAGFLIIMTLYTIALLAWMVFDGQAAIDVVLFYLLGVPVVVLAVWWGAQARQKRR
jgi:hypothetical protein